MSRALYIACVLLLGCLSDEQQRATEEATEQPAANKVQIDTIVLEPQVEEEEAVNIFDLHDKYIPIIDSIVHLGRLHDSLKLWQHTSVYSMPGLAQSTEGDELQYSKRDSFIRYFYRLAGENGRSEEEFYLFNDSLHLHSFVEYSYERPIYWDSAMAAENNDSIVFGELPHDILIEDSYFVRGELVYQVSNVESITTVDYMLKAEKQIMDRLRKIQSYLASDTAVAD